MIQKWNKLEWTQSKNHQKPSCQNSLQFFNRVSSIKERKKAGIYIEDDEDDSSEAPGKPVSDLVVYATNAGMNYDSGLTTNILTLTLT